jgi:hypothetical protein
VITFSPERSLIRVISSSLRQDSCRISQATTLCDQATPATTPHAALHQRPDRLAEDLVYYEGANSASALAVEQTALLTASQLLNIPHSFAAILYIQFIQLLQLYVAVI